MIAYSLILTKKSKGNHSYSTVENKFIFGFWKKNASKCTSQWEKDKWHTTEKRISIWKKVIFHAFHSILIKIPPRIAAISSIYHWRQIDLSRLLIIIEQFSVFHLFCLKYITCDHLSLIRIVVGTASDGSYFKFSQFLLLLLLAAELIWLIRWLKKKMSKIVGSHL